MAQKPEQACRKDTRRGALYGYNGRCLKVRYKVTLQLICTLKQKNDIPVVFLRLVIAFSVYDVVGYRNKKRVMFCRQNLSSIHTLMHCTPQ